ncbi:tyrosine-type recombinase/integrase, partial [Rhodococcus sp. NPDC058514]
MAAGSRRRGKGSITSYETKSGTRWRWQLYVPIDPENPDDGVRQTGGGGFKTAADADEALDDAKRKLKARMTFARSVPTVAEYVDQWIDGRALERSTIAGYRRLARNHIRPYFGTTQLDKLTSAKLAKHYRELQAQGRRDGKGGGLSANTTAKVAALLSAVLDAAVSDGLIVANPAKKRAVVQPPTGRQIRAAKPEMHVWTGDQLAAFLQWCRDQDDVLFPLWSLIAHTGTRRSEALALRWGDVDMTNGRVAIRRALDTTQRATTKLTKSGGSRVVD